MELFEKVEKLREKANVSYEDAKAALEAANGDILDAMIILEKEGKTAAPEADSYSTKYEDNSQLVVVADVEDNSGKGQAKDKKEKKDSELARKFRVIWRKSCENYFIVERKDERILKLPIWLFILIVLIGIHFVPIAMIVALFFGCHYKFEGEAEMKTANDVMNKADKVVEQVKEEYKKL